MLCSGWNVTKQSKRDWWWKRRDNSPEASREAKLVPRGKGSERADKPGRFAAMLANWLAVRLTGHDKDPATAVLAVLLLLLLPLAAGRLVIVAVLLWLAEVEQVVVDTVPAETFDNAEVVAVEWLWRAPFIWNDEETAGCCCCWPSPVPPPTPPPPPPPPPLPWLPPF